MVTYGNARNQRNVVRLLLALALATTALFALSGGAAQSAAVGLDRANTAQVATLASAKTPARWRAIEIAETQKGCWYHYGNEGPCSRGFDCSGLVSWAYGKVGFHFGRSTGQMLASGKLIRTRSPKWGDLVFWSGHVELYSSGRYSFGAQKSGTRVGYHRYWGHFSYYHVRGSG